jgi:hypothetical protein
LTGRREKSLGNPTKLTENALSKKEKESERNNNLKEIASLDFPYRQRLSS